MSEETKEPKKKAAKKTGSKPGHRLRRKLGELWPNSNGKVWPPTGKHGGWASVPRTFSLILRLLDDKELSGNIRLSSAYVDLMSINMGEGIIEVSSEDDRRYAAGYAHARQWRDRIMKLEELGFIKIFPKGRRQLGYIVIVHPHIAVTKLRDKGRINDEWYSAYYQVIEDCNITIPDPEIKPFSVIKGGAGTSELLDVVEEMLGVKLDKAPTGD